MSGIILPNRFTQQPQYPAPVNNTHPFGNRRWNCVYVPGVMLYGAANPALALSSNNSYGVNGGGRTLSNSGAAIAGGGASFGANAGMMLNASSGLIVFNYLGASGQTLFDLGYGPTASGLNAFLLSAYTTTVYLLRKDVAVVQGTSNAPVQNAQNALAWSYNHSTGRGKLALNGILTSFTSSITFIQNNAALGGYWGDDVAGNAANQHNLFMLSPDECFSDQALIKASINPWQIFKAPDRTIWIGAAAGGGAQTLTPTLYSNSQTFYAPTVSRGAVTLTAGLFTNSNTFYGHTLTTTYGLVASLFTNIPSFYAPTVSAGSVTLAPTLFSNAATFYAHTVSQGAAPQTLTPTLYSNAQTFYTPTVTAGSVALTATRLDNAQTFYVPVVTISGGPQYLVPGLYSESQTFYSPSVVPGSVTLTATRFDNAESFYAHTVSQSSSEQTIVPSLFIDSQTFYTHTLTGGVATLIPSLYMNDQEFYSATVVNVGVFVIPTARSTQQNIFSKRRTTSSRRLPNT